MKALDFADELKYKYALDAKKIISNLYKSKPVSSNYETHCGILGDDERLLQIFYLIARNYDPAKANSNDPPELALDKYVRASLFKQLNREAGEIINGNLNEPGSNIEDTGTEDKALIDDTPKPSERDFDLIRINPSLTEKEKEFVQCGLKYAKTHRPMHKIAKEMKISLQRAYFIKKNLQAKQENKEIDTKKKGVKCPICGQYFVKAKQAKYCSTPGCIKKRTLERVRKHRKISPKA